MEAFALFLLATLVYKIIDFLKDTAGALRKERTWNAPVTQVISWFAGVVVIFIAAEASLTNEVAIPFDPQADIVLKDLDSWSLVLLGLTVSSFASFTNGVVGAIDKNRSTEKPPLVR